MFKEGDKVRIVGNEYTHGFEVGEVGIITKYEPSNEGLIPYDDQVYLVEIDGQDWWCTENDLEVVDG